MSGMIDKVASVLGDGGAVIRALVAERDKLAEDNQQLRGAVRELTVQQEAQKVASECHRRGLYTDMPFDQLVTKVATDFEQGRGESIKQALDMIGPNPHHSIELGDDNIGGASSRERLESLILHGEY